MSFTKCFPPSFGVSPQIAGLFGLIAETTIAAAYLRNRGKTVWFPANAEDYSDFTAGWANVTLYTTFLSERNPRISVSHLLSMRRNLGGDDGGSLFKIPDIATDTRAIKQFYEIKPNSSTGVIAGDDKVANIVAFNDYFKLPYSPGTFWQPDNRILLYDGILESVGFRVKVFYHYFQIQPGLIVYELCIEADVRITALLALIIIATIVLLIVFGPEIMAGVAAAGELVEGAAALAGAAIPALGPFGGLVPILFR